MNKLTFFTSRAYSRLVYRVHLSVCQCRLLPHLLLAGLGLPPGGPLHRLRARGGLHAGLLGECWRGAELVPIGKQRLHR